MTLSPFHKASLPSLRPGQSSPAVPTKSKPPLHSHSLSSQSGHNATSLAQHDSATGTRGLPKKTTLTPFRSIKLESPQHHVGPKTQGSTFIKGPSSSTGPISSRSAPMESRNLPKQRRGRGDESFPAIPKPQSSKHAGPARLSPSKKSNQSSAKTTISNHSKPSANGDDGFFFRLTDGELATFRRKHRKGPTYRFHDRSIAQELNRLGRGWEGYYRARRKAEKKGTLDEFRRQLQTEGRLMSTRLPLPAGAISMQAAVDASNRTKYTASRGNEQTTDHDRAKAKASEDLSIAAVDFQQGPTAVLGKSAALGKGNQDHNGPYESMRDRDSPYSSPKFPESETAEFEVIPSDSEDEYQPPDSTAMSKADSQHRHRGRQNGLNDKTISSSSVIDRPRPKRVETRPDYRIRRIRERRAELPPNPPSPTPRDLYEQSQPRFLQFKCEWAGCKAVLNNVANTRKHVGIAHGQEARDTLCCNWGRCGRDDSTGVLSIFRCIEDLDVHIETLHMESLKWHLGDGRLGRGLVVKDSGMGNTSYLYSNGEQVTPSIDKQRTETSAEWRARQERLKEILLKTALNAPSDSEPESLDNNEDTQDTVLL